MRKLYPILLFLLFPALNAQSPNHGYVVKIDEGTVYLDITDIKPAPEKGTSFDIFADGEPLYNPVTQKTLGSVPVNKGGGVITEVYPSFAIGKINGGKTEAAVGDKVNFFKEQKIAADPFASPQAVKTNKDTVDEKPSNYYKNANVLWKSERLPYMVSGITLADVDGDGKNEIITLDEDHYIRANKLEDGKLKELYNVRFARTMRPLWLDSAFENKETKILAVVNNTATGEINTIVYTAGKDGFTEETTVRFMVAAAVKDAGAKEFYAIEKYKSKNLELSPVKTVEFKKGVPVMKSMASWPRFKWIFGLTFAELSGERALVYSADGDKISVQFEKRANYASTGDDFTRTPLRINQNGSIMYFYPRVAVHTKNGETYAYAAINKAKMGILSYAFGSFQSGAIRRLTWKDNHFVFEEKDDDFKTPGYVVNFILGNAGNYENTLVVPAIGSDEKTIISIIEP